MRSFLWLLCRGCRWCRFDFLSLVFPELASGRGLGQVPHAGVPEIVTCPKPLPEVCVRRYFARRTSRAPKALRTWGVAANDFWYSSMRKPPYPMCATRLTRSRNTQNKKATSKQGGFFNGKREGQSLKATTFWCCSPRPSMPSVITSPRFKYTGAGLPSFFTPMPTPGGVPVQITSPGFKVTN
jgi:hypothetical protein